MSFIGSTRINDVVCPKCVMMAFAIRAGVVDPDGIDLGYVQQADLNSKPETKERYTARDKSLGKIYSLVRKTDESITAKLISLNANNLAFMFGKSKGSLIQTVGAYGVTGLDLEAPAELNRVIKLGKRNVKITAIGYDGGTEPFTVGKELSTGSSTAVIVWVDGDTTSGTLYVVSLTGDDFVNDAVLVDDGTPTPGAAVQNGAVVVQDDIVLTDETGTVRYTLGTDYDLIPRSGHIFIKDGVTIVPTDKLEVYCDYPALTEVIIEKGATAVGTYQIEIVPDKAAGENATEVIAWNASVVADTKLQLLTEGNDESEIDLTLNLLVGGPGATATEPTHRLIIDEAA